MKDHKKSERPLFGDRRRDKVLTFLDKREGYVWHTEREKGMVMIKNAAPNFWYCERASRQDSRILTIQGNPGCCEKVTENGHL